MKKRTLSLLLTAALIASLAGCSKPAEAPATSAADTAATDTSEAGKTDETTAEAGTGSQAAAEDKATFTVGFDQNFPPMGFVGDDGEHTGFDLELAQEVAKRLGKEFVPQPIEWDAKDMELSAGTIDCIWNGFTMTGREDNYTWTEPYMDNSQVFVVKKDSGIAAFADLKGKIVEVQADSSAEAALKENEELTSTFGNLQTTPDYNTAFMDLEMGAVDAIAMDIIVARYQIKQRNADFVILEEVISSEKYAVGFKKGNTELRDKVQDTLKEMAADGTLKTVSEKWFGEDITTIK